MLSLLIIRILLLASVTLVRPQRVVTAGTVPPDEQDYDFSSAKRCRLLAHKSAILENSDHDILVLDSGFGAFSTELNGEKVTVLDLNPWTVAFDLSQNFLTPDLEPLWAVKKPNGASGPPITNTGGIWSSEDQSTIWYQGGHYYNSTNWTSSLYHVDKWHIPPWQLWQMDVSHYQQGWKNVTTDTEGHEDAIRTFAGAAVSIPNAGKSFWLGGLVDGTTAESSPNDTSQTVDQMLMYNHANGSISSQKYYLPTSKLGQYQGHLIHLPIGPGNGYILSLMSEERPVDTPYPDPDGASGDHEIGQPVSLDSIPLYDIDGGFWFEQQTSWYMDEIPEPRTRFCAAVFYDKQDKTWNVWMHGGQKLSDQNEGVQDIYVLSMPSFIWTKVETTLPETNLIRSHSCHAVGGQFIIVGGYPAGADIPAFNATCDPEYIKVLNIGRDGPAWAGAFLTKTSYANPQSVRDIIGTRTAPMEGFANKKLEDDFKHNSLSGRSIVGKVVGGVVGTLAILAVAGIVIWRCRKRKARNTTMRAPDSRKVPAVRELSRKAQL